MTEKFPRNVVASELKVGDVIDLYDGPFSTAIVKMIGNNLVHFYRPYGTHADFTCTSGVICYMGLEEFTVMRDGTSTYKLWRHADHLK
jgi:hypothetical protein